MVINKVNGLLLSIEYNTNEQNQSIIHLYVKTNKRIELFTDSKFHPYYYVKVTNKKEALKELNEFKEIKILKIKECENKTNLLKLYFNSTSDLTNSRQKIRELKTIIELLEMDILYTKRYLLDKNLTPLNNVEITHENNEVKTIKETECKNPLKKLKLLAFDLETYSPNGFSNPENDEIITISIYSNNIQKVLTYKKEFEGKNTIILKNEKTMIQKFVEIIREEKPDVIITYNGDSFDFPYLKERAKKHKLKLGIGFDKSEPKTRRVSLFTAEKLLGVQHFDAFQMTKFLTRIGVINTPNLTLETIIETVFGVKKEKVTAETINKIWETTKNTEKLINYNLEDSKTTLELTEKFLPIFIELGKITKQPLFDVNRSTSSQNVEMLLMQESLKQHKLFPNKPSEREVKKRMLTPIKGGYVKEPIPGLHERIAVLDFRSLYPSIIISHNISPETICNHPECVKKNTSPENITFCIKQNGIIPTALKKILEKRIELKKEIKNTKNKELKKTLNARQHALKILLNSTYGTLVYPRFRWYCRECGKSITAWAREYTKKTLEKARKQGFKPLYADSVSKKRFIPILNKNKIELKNIEELFKENSKKIFKKNGKELIKIKGLKTLSLDLKTNKTEWMKINYLIRHKINKKMFRVNQKLGETIVTKDHSLIVEKNNETQCIKPTELKKAKLIRLNKIPETKKIKEIDLFKELKKYSYETKYKNQTRTSKIHAKNNYLWFGWSNQKNRVMLKRKIKTNSKEFKALCELCGAFIAEGSTSTIETTIKKGASISSSNKKWLKKIEKNYHELFINTKTKIIQSTKKKRTLKYLHKGKQKIINYQDKTLKLQMMNELTAVFFKVLCGQKSNEKKLPTFIFNVEKKYKKILLNKIIEGNGSKKYDSRYSKKYVLKNFRIELKSLEAISGISFLLNQLNQKHTITYRKEKNTHSIRTCSKYNKRLETKINEEKYSGFVYDLEVEKNNNFVDACGNILLHNTDSAFLITPKNKNQQDIKEFVKKINSELPETMELEFEGFFKRGIFVTKKEGGAAKKRYALIDYNDKMKITGFETVRRDWANITKKTQKKVLELILKDGTPLKAIQEIKKTIKKIREGNIPKQDLIILTRLKKPIQKYENISPHIAAAKKAIQKGKKLTIGSTLEFIITSKGKTISEKSQLAEFVKQGDYDKEYYINHQIIPAIQRIIEELGYTKQDILIGGKQQNLFNY